ncbi:MAG: hypothetical protein AB4372_23860, partial [Xenococcus sp. (in: cyanobacteria)]
MSRINGQYQVKMGVSFRLNLFFAHQKMVLIAREVVEPSLNLPLLAQASLGNLRPHTADSTQQTWSNL